MPIFPYILILSVYKVLYTCFEYNCCAMENFSKNLKEIRTAKGISQKEMAELLGVSFRTYQNWELLDSNHREPDLNMLCKISKALDVSVDYLLDLSQY